MDQKDEKNTSFQFMKQTIREKPADRKKRLKSFLFVLVCAAAAGVVAAFVFVAVTPLARRLTGQETAGERVELKETSETPVPTVTPDTPTPTETPAQTETPTPSPEQTQEEEEAEPVSGLETYENIYGEMKTVAAQASNSIVKVIGIRDQMDYFKKNYEDQQQISGVIIAESGDNYYILTEYRVLDGIERIQVTFCDGTSANAVYHAHDSATGLAIVTVAVSDVTESTRNQILIASLQTESATGKGDPVIALGSPMGYSDALSYGVVTSVDNKVSLPDREFEVLTTDILGSEGGSGVLIDLEGTVIGIIDQDMSASTDKMTVTALKTSQIRDLVERLSNREEQAYIGIRGQNVTAELSQQTGIPRGVLVTGIEEQSPAMLSGLMQYDLITGLGEDSFETLSQYTEALAQVTPGQKVVLHAMRKGVEGYTDIDFEIETTAAE